MMFFESREGHLPVFFKFWTGGADRRLEFLVHCKGIWQGRNKGSQSVMKRGEVVGSLCWCVFGFVVEVNGESGARWSGH